VKRLKLVAVLKSAFFCSNKSTTCRSRWRLGLDDVEEGLAADGRRVRLGRRCIQPSVSVSDAV